MTGEILGVGEDVEFIGEHDESERHRPKELAPEVHGRSGSCPWGWPRAQGLMGNVV